MTKHPCEWHGNGDPCRTPAAYLVEWDEDGMEFGSFLCGGHTTAISEGISPFEEYGSAPVVLMVRTTESVLASAKAEHPSRHRL